MKQTLIITLALTVASCYPLTKTVKQTYRYELYIDYEHISYQGSNDSQSIYFVIDSLVETPMRFYGTVIINEKDSVNIRGFEKGNIYLAWATDYDSEILEILTPGDEAQILDSIVFRRADFLSQNTTLYRKPRINCP